MERRRIRSAPQPRFVAVHVEDAKEQARIEAVVVRTTTEARGVADDGAPPGLAHTGAADNGGVLHAEDDLQEEVSR